MSKINTLLGCAIVLSSVSAMAQSHAPLTLACPAGAICRSNSASGNGQNTTSYADPNAGHPDATEPEEEKIWSVARQLKLNADQRSQLDSSLKAQKGESADLAKALVDARDALAHALQNGQSSFEGEIENLASAGAKVQESELKRWASLYAVLTPDQQKQLLTMPTPLSLASGSPETIQTHDPDLKLQ
jgi:Spy/CpxP family protein refolding chaperone